MHPAAINPVVNDRRRRSSFGESFGERINKSERVADAELAAAELAAAELANAELASASLIALSNGSSGSSLDILCV
jgi:hypothetical protein